jgi:hypothetical protein
LPNPELDWIAEKACEMLVDKVKDGPLTDHDVKLAFEIFAQPRLKKLYWGRDERELGEAVDYVMNKLRGYAEQLNLSHWTGRKINFPK